MWKGCIPSVCLLCEFSNLQTTLCQTNSSTIGVGKKSDVCGQWSVVQCTARQFIWLDGVSVMAPD